MPINVNNSELGALAALASRGTPDLGLKSYGVDVGAPAVGYAAGVLNKAKLDQEYAALGNAQLVAMLNNNAALYKQQQQQNFDAVQKGADRTNTANIAASRDTILQNRNNVMDQYNQGRLGIDQTNANINQQNADQNGAYKQGTLGVQQQNSNVDANYKAAEVANAQKDTQLKYMQYASTMDDKTRNMTGSYFAGIMSSIQHIQDPQKRADAINNLIDDGVNQGVFSNDMGTTLKSMPVNQLYAKSVQGVTLMSHGAQLNQSMNQQGLSFMPDSQGNMQAVPLSKAQNDKNQTMLLAIDNAKQAAQAQLTTLQGVDKTGTDYFNLGARTKGTIGAVEGLVGYGGDGTDEDFNANRNTWLANNNNIAGTLSKSMGNAGVSNRNIGIFLNQLPTSDNTTSNAEAIKRLTQGISNLDRARSVYANPYSQGISTGQSSSPTQSTTSQGQAPQAAPTASNLTLNGVPYNNDTHTQFISAIKQAYPSATDDQVNQYLNSQLGQ